MPVGPGRLTPAGVPQPHYLGVDIGGTKVALRVETDAGCVAETAFGWAPRHSAERDLGQLAGQLGELRGQLGTPWHAVGVAMPATVGADGRISTWPSRPEWSGVALDSVLRELFPDTTVGWADDGDLGALAEARASGCPDLLYLGIGTGVGGGFVLGGVPCPGPERGSFELGHLIVEPGGPRCACGRRGCLQAIASGPATLHRAGVLRGAPAGYHELRAALRDGESWATAAVGETCRALAVAVTGVQELLHPRQLLIGGGFAAGLPELAGLIAGQLAELARPGQRPLPVAPATLGGLSSLRGAVSLARLLTPRPRQ